MITIIGNIITIVPIVCVTEKPFCGWMYEGKVKSFRLAYNWRETLDKRP